MDNIEKYLHPYTFAPAYQKRVAYFCMDYAIAQSLKLYAGGLGFLAGSHMRSAYDLKQNVIAIGILWKYGYYDQIRQTDQTMGVLFQEKVYSFVQKTDIRFEITVNRAPVQVGVYYLPPHIFGTVPFFLLSTDLPENSYMAQSISHKLYDSDKTNKIAASILLGVGGFKLLELLGLSPDVYHMNEAHALPLVFPLYEKYGNVEDVRKRVVFTTHTPEEAGNDKTDIRLLSDMSFFSQLSTDQVKEITKIEGEVFDHSLAALRLSRLSNAVSRMHLDTARNIWSKYTGICPIMHITNAQSYTYWADKYLYDYLQAGRDDKLLARKRKLKKRLFEEVADQTGDMLHEDVFTIVWARRFASYKRAGLLLEDMDRLHSLLTNDKYPVQLIWAGKPYPVEYGEISVFNQLVRLSAKYPNCSVLVGYELKLSKLLKQGADLWLNTPLVTHEASGTSGMTAAMNASVILSTPDGWIPEFVQHGRNGFVVPKVDVTLPVHEQNDLDAKHMYDVLEQEILPLYYTQKSAWLNIIKNSMQGIVPYFDSERLAQEYYEKLYNA
ncbi:alpha-glucan family phosphorylase [Pontibacter ruber]|uniref:Alpha-glucan family phosphorylase n=1 Tax=Pontibacter ruber TaxID=1343895 RepID=A0ABW5D0N3_9BACT|nr:alpha-glucan family phosphorylase [Pontibacter ruber]